MTPLLHTFRWVVVNSSGGKDSQAALHRLVELADAQGFDRRRIVVSHQCLGEAEWSGTRALAEAQAGHYGLRFEVSKYRDRFGNEITLLNYIRRRGRWPDNKNRYCTSEFKRGPGGRILTALSKEAPGDILNIYGFRAEESPARAKKVSYSFNTRFSSARRQVWDWLPIHTWKTADVWGCIRASGAPSHPAYALGMSRLSCVFCVFASKKDLLIAGKANPALLERYCELEAAMGHTFQNGTSLAEIRAEIQSTPTSPIPPFAA